MPPYCTKFRGFLPAKSGARRTELEKLIPAEYTAVFYEAPHRIVEAMRAWQFAPYLDEGHAVRVCAAAVFIYTHN